MWLSVVGAVLTFLTTMAQSLGSLATWLRESALRKQGNVETENQILKQENVILEKAIETREEARIANAAVPQSDSLPNDGFRRD